MALHGQTTGIRREARGPSPRALPAAREIGYEAGLSCKSCAEAGDEGLPRAAVTGIDTHLEKDRAMKSSRRLAPISSATRALMLEGAEAILREEGYAVLTSRRIANRIGVKQQLVFYYFQTMDDLIVEAFRQLAKRELERLESALQSVRPLHEIWEVCINTSDARLIAEFMALAHRNDRLRTEVIAHIERMRRIHVEALSRACKNNEAGPAALAPVAISFLASSAALALTRENALGVSMGHAEVEALMRQSLALLEPNGAEIERPSPV